MKPVVLGAQVKLLGLQRKAARQHGPYDVATKTRREPSTGWRRTQTDIANCGACLAQCTNQADRCTAGSCACGTGPVCEFINECSGGTCS